MSGVLSGFASVGSVPSCWGWPLVPVPKVEVTALWRLRRVWMGKATNPALYAENALEEIECREFRRGNYAELCGPAVGALRFLAAAKFTPREAMDWALEEWKRIKVAYRKGEYAERPDNGREASDAPAIQDSH
jgi:hypothetical protein